MTEERKTLECKGDYKLVRTTQTFKGCLNKVIQYQIEHKKVSISKFSEEDIARNFFDDMFTKELEVVDETNL